MRLQNSGGGFLLLERREEEVRGREEEGRREVGGRERGGGRRGDSVHVGEHGYTCCPTRVTHAIQ